MQQPFRKILVTGGAGFIGSHVVDALLADGCSVTVFDDFNDYYAPSIKEANASRWPDTVRVVRGDIRDRPLVDEVFAAEAFEAVIHLAARAGVRPSIRDPRLYVSTNVDGTLNLLEAARVTGVKQFVFASSSSVYGINRKVPFSEADPIERTISPYAATKLMGEQLCSNYSHLHGLPCVCLRFFTVYGPGQRPDLAIAKFTRNILDGVPVQQYGDGTTARDYTFIDDIVSGVMAAVAYTGNPFEIFNLGGSETHTLKELIATVEDAVGKKALIEFLPDQPGDVPRTFADVTKAGRLLGYRPSTPFKTGVRRYVEWVRERENASTAPQA